MSYRTKDQRTPINTLPICCARCERDLAPSYFYDIKNSLFFGEKIPFCRDCVNKLYEKYYEKMTKAGFKKDADIKTIERLCMAFDCYFDKDLFMEAKKQTVPDSGISLANIYFMLSQKSFNVDMTYDNNYFNDGDPDTTARAKRNKKEEDVSDETMDFFGDGYSLKEYRFLQSQYDEWTSRNECSTKAQEELFKNLCYIQLELQKAHRDGVDTKDLDRTFREYLSAANLQPKQAASAEASQNYTMGTLLQMWEKTDPVPEPDDDLKDVDNMVLYTDAIYRGHMAKMLGLKNAFSNLYAKFMEKYTVKKPEYDAMGDGDSDETIFDRVFGSKEL